MKRIAIMDYILMTDIKETGDIAIVVNAFYKKVVADPLIAHFFTEAVQLSWEKHIPVMISFWETLLLDKITYRGNPMIKHIELNRVAPIGHLHFERWIQLWKETVRENFSGPKADEAIGRAEGIAKVIESKLKDNSFIATNAE